MLYTSLSCNPQTELHMQGAANEIQELISKPRHNSFQFTGGVLFVKDCSLTKLGITDNR